MGIGTLWQSKVDVAEDAPCGPYNGANAIREWQAISTCTNEPPVEQDMGEGFACAHWDEDCMGNELMTPKDEAPGTDEPLSRITVGSLEDLGYEVNYGAAEPFTKSDLNPSCQCNNRRHSLLRRQLNSGEGGDASKKNKKHKLSEAVHNAAVSYGQSVLAERAAEHRGRAYSDNVEYVGDQVISIVVKDDDGRLYSVIVTNES